MSETATQETPRPYTAYTLDQWLRIKRDYITGKGRLMDLCQKYGMNRQTVATRSCREKWEKYKLAYIARKNAAIESLADEPAVAPTQEQPDTPAESHVSVIQRQLELVDNAIFTAVFPRDIADLTKAKRQLEESLFIALHGMKPGTMKPTRSRRPNAPTLSPIPSAPEPTDQTPTPLPVVEGDSTPSA